MNHKLTIDDHHSYLLTKLEEIQQVIRNISPLAARNQVLIFAYSLIFGQLNYLAPVLPRMTNSQYNKIQRYITHILFDILNVPFIDRRHISTATVLNAVGWLSYKNNVKRLRIKYLHDIFVSSEPARLYRIISTLVYMIQDNKQVCFEKPRVRDVLDLPIYFNLTNSHMFANLPPAVRKNIFPFNAMSIFNELPQHVRALFGHPDFTHTLNLHFHTLCQHRAGKAASKCSQCVVQPAYTEKLLHSFNNAFTTVSSALPHILDFAKISLKEQASEIDMVKKWAIETVLCSQLPAIMAFDVTEQIERTAHATLRALQEANLIPSETNLFS